MKKIWYTIVLAALLCGLTGCFEEEMSPAETAPVSETVVVGETELVSETANPASYQQISQEEAGAAPFIAGAPQQAAGNPAAGGSQAPDGIGDELYHPGCAQTG